MEKSIRNADAVVHQLKPTSTKATNNRLEVTRKERRKKEEMMKR